jgi:hypothetical protein
MLKDSEKNSIIVINCPNPKCCTIPCVGTATGLCGPSTHRRVALSQLLYLFNRNCEMPRAGQMLSMSPSMFMH